MKAMAFSSYGEPDVLQMVDLPTPQAGPGQVRVRVKAAGVQPVDAMVRRGAFADASAPAPAPQTLGNEFAGVVDRVGDGVEGFAPGDAVLGWASMACYAEYVVAPPGQIVAKPGGMPWAVAGVMSASGQTAHTALRALGVAEGDTVLIHAAAGGVGTVAVQLARIWGAGTVIGTASASNHDYLRSLGAVPVTYGAGLAERVRAVAPDGVDVALDAAGRGALEASVALVRDRDRIGTIVDFEKAPRLGVRSIRSERLTERLAELVALYEQGRLRIHIRRALPLHRAADAHREIETGHGRGKIVLLAE